jgi:hypothetical protein
VAFRIDQLDPEGRDDPASNQLPDGPQGAGKLGGILIH